jgi:hypothetical protein
MNTMDKYLHIKSDDSDYYFSDNEVYRFKVHLNMPLTLNGKWAVALIEFNAVDVSMSRTKTTDSIYIYKDLARKALCSARNNRC